MCFPLLTLLAFGHELALTSDIHIVIVIVIVIQMSRMGTTQTLDL